MPCCRAVITGQGWGAACRDKPLQWEELPSDPAPEPGPGPGPALRDPAFKCSQPRQTHTAVVFAHRRTDTQQESQTASKAEKEGNSLNSSELGNPAGLHLRLQRLSSFLFECRAEGGCRCVSQWNSGRGCRLLIRKASGRASCPDRKPQQSHVEEVPRSGPRTDPVRCQNKQET